MISDKTVELLTKLREACEEVAAEDDLDINECADRLDVLTDIMACLMTANAIEQRAIMAKDCGDACKAVEAMCDDMNKDKEMVN